MNSYYITTDLIVQKLGGGHSMAHHQERQLQGYPRIRREVVSAQLQRKQYRGLQTRQRARVMARQHALPPTLAPRLIGRDAAAAYVSVAPNTFDAMVREGRLPKPRVLTAGRKAWDVRLLDQAIDELPLEGENSGSMNDGWDD